MTKYIDDAQDLTNMSDERQEHQARVLEIINDREHYTDEEADKAQREYMEKWYGK